jgi:hypothetical protein
MENENAVQIIPQQVQSLQPIPIKDVVAQVKAIEECIKSVMVSKLHYGTIPGCGEKPTLLKPGAEMLAKLFNLRPEYKRERHDLGNGHIEIMSDCTMFSRATGTAVGSGAGTCSTMESKYRWRKSQRACPACGVDGSIGRSKFPPKDNPTGQPGWYCRDCKAQFAYDASDIRNQQAGRVENPDIADQYNTVQKMADKRAYVASVITSVGASDFVTQDIEDFYDGMPDAVSPVTPKPENAQKPPTKPETQPEPTKPQTAPQNGGQGPANEPETKPTPKMTGLEAGKHIKAALESREKADSWGIFKEQIGKKYHGEKLTDIMADHYDEIMAYIEAGKADLPF